MKQGYSRERPDLSSGLVGYWPLHDESATDYSGNGNHGNLNNGVTTGVAGRGGLQAMSFDGNDDYIDISKSVSSEFGSGSFTVAAWVNIDSSGRILDNRNESSGFAGIVMNISNGKIVLSIDDGSNAEIVKEGSVDIRDGQWHHVAVMRDNSSNDLRIFVDGEEDASSTYTDTSGGNVDSYGDVSHNKNTQIGAEYVTSDNNAAAYIEGSIMDVRTYSKALSDSEIQTLYEWGNGDFARPPNQDEGGISYWPLDGNADDSWSENNGSVNGASFVADAIRGQACDFTRDQGDYISVLRSTELEPSTFTVSVWVKRESYSGEKSQRVIDKGGNNYGYQITFGNSGDQDPYRPNAVVGDTFLIPPNDIHSLGEWYHVVLVYDGSTASLYSNGVNIVSESASVAYDSRDLYIGQRDDGAKHYDGLVDDIRIYNRALTPNEIFELYRYGTRGRDMRKQLVNF